MREPLFVDCHSHVVPSGDDGAGSVAEGRRLCVEAARTGTRILYATPHVWPHLTLTADREAAVRRAFAALAPGLPLELRLGFELTPTQELLGHDLRRYALDGLDALLMEVPFVGPADDLFVLAEEAERQGLRPVIAHPERADAVLSEPRLARDLAQQGRLLQLNGTSLLGRHGVRAQRLAWELLEAGEAALVGSDGHRDTRPPRLDEAYAAVCERVGREAARPLFDGSALGLAPPERFSVPAPSRAAKPAA